MILKNDIFELIAEEGKKDGNLLIGFARLDEGKIKSIDDEISNSSANLPFAVSIAIPLNREVLQTITNHPTVIYKHHYQQINYFLDRATLRISQFIEKKGYRALPIPASIYTSRSDLKAHLSHRDIAYRAGLGWWGKCNLVIHPQFGAGIRLATILTDLELPVTPPLDNDCGNCQACSDACPAHAIGKDISEFNRSVCFAQVKEFERKLIGVGICGICVRACRETLTNRTKTQNSGSHV
jgi:epoxyqueuosine reductase